MAPKKKSKGGKGGKSGGGIVDGVSTSEMSREQLESFVQRIQLELQREREERNFFQLERDKISSFWEITRQQLVEFKACLRNKDKELEEYEEKHQTEIKVYNQKVKHLMHEQNIQLSQIKAENMVSLKIAEDRYKELELDLLRDKEALKIQIKELKEAQLDQIRTLLLERKEQVEEIQINYENKCKFLELKYEQELENLRNELDLKNEIEISQTEERKDIHINELLNKHEKSFTQLKEYYSKITNENFKLISSLKDKIKEMKNNRQATDKQINDVRKENQKLLIPLKEAQQQVASLTHKLSTYEREERKTKITEKQLSAAIKKEKELRYVYDELVIAHENLLIEKKKTEERFTSYIMDMQQNFVLKILGLEGKISVLNRSLNDTKEQTETSSIAHFPEIDLPPSLSEEIQNVLKETRKKLKELEQA